ncbi:hypothetical protein CsatB_013937 [Cannabis sativa]
MAPTAPGFYTLNVDDAYNEEAAIIGIGAIFRDYAGDVIAAFSRSLKGCYSIKEMEANAIIYSLQWAFANQLAILYIETDFLLVANAINKASSKICVSHF